MIAKLTAKNLARAIAKCFVARCHVRRVAEDTYICHCPNGHDHLVTFDGDTAECFECPSELGHNICYHIAATAAVHFGIQEMREAVERAMRATVLPFQSLARRMDSSIMVKVENGRPVERVRGIRI